MVLRLHSRRHNSRARMMAKRMAMRRMLRRVLGLGLFIYILGRVVIHNKVRVRAREADKCVVTYVLFLFAS